jgi:hypothetical protein
MNKRNPWRPMIDAPTTRDISVMFMTEDGLTVSGARWCPRSGFWLTPRYRLRTLDVFAWMELPGIPITTN